ncbi:ComEA family DNA-binding protein [Falsiporphyromonas endometrii]|uniref:ComEA family DNA-binding protein n=1 Tax=Falsiporphyromonas endometrii TaxID=1387297 RepID=A0ABV9K7Q9_9PORP
MKRKILRFLKVGRGELIVLTLLLIAVLIIVSFVNFCPSKEVASYSLQNESLRMDSIDNRPTDDTIETSIHYVGPPKHIKYKPKEKLPLGTQVDLNSVDSATLTKIPGIGPVFARRIVRYRKILRGYYTVLQLQEVYGMTQERYLGLKPWFCIKTHPARISFDSIKTSDDLRHPYINYLQRKEILKLLRRYGKISSWDQIMRLKTIGYDDSVRLSHYFYIPGNIKTKETYVSD